MAKSSSPKIKEVSAKSVQEMAQGLLADPAKSPVFQGIDSPSVALFLEVSSQNDAVTNHVVAGGPGSETKQEASLENEGNSIWTVVTKKSPLKSHKPPSAVGKQGTVAISPNGLGILDQIGEEGESGVSENNQTHETDTIREEGEVVESDADEDNVVTKQREELVKETVSGKSTLPPKEVGSRKGRSRSRGPKQVIARRKDGGQSNTASTRKQ